MEPDPRYEVRKPEIERLLRRLAKHIDGERPSDLGFCLFLFPSEVGSVFYIANVDRSDAVKAVQEWVRSNKERGH